MTSTQAPRTRLDVERSALSPDAKVVLDYLCRRPAAILDFADIADDMKMPRARVEEAVAQLRHQRHGQVLATYAPWGEALPLRRAYLPATAPLRGEYPPLEHPELKRPRAHEVQKPSPADARNAQAAKNAEEVKRAKLAAKARRLEVADVILANAKANNEARAQRTKEREENEAKLLSTVRPAAPEAKAAPVAAPAPAPEAKADEGNPWAAPAASPTKKGKG